MKIDIRIGDCFELIKDLPDNSVDLVITSPPYSDIMSYGKNVSVKKPSEYVDWILPLFREIHRVLKPTGSFILNIGDKCENGYRSTMIYEMIYRNSKETPLKLYDTYFWHKKSGLPNGSKKRFRTTTEFIFHFCKDKNQMTFHMDRVLYPSKESSIGRVRYAMESTIGFTDEGTKIKKTRIRYTNKSTDENGSSNDKFVERIIPLVSRPDNVVRFNTAAGGLSENAIKHPAPYHKELPSYYISFLTDEGDVVLDPFSGIGTTGVSCKELNRDYIGFELNPLYAEFSIKRLEKK